MAKHERRAVFFLLLTGGKSSQTTTTTRHKGQETVFGKKEEKMFFVSPFKKGAVFLERRRLMWACFRRGAKSKAGEKLEVGERQRIRAVNLLTHSWSRRSNTLNVCTHYLTKYFPVSALSAGVISKESERKGHKNSPDGQKSWRISRSSSLSLLKGEGASH